MGRVGVGLVDGFAVGAVTAVVWPEAGVLAGAAGGGDVGRGDTAVAGSPAGADAAGGVSAELQAAARNTTNSSKKTRKQCFMFFVPLCLYLGLALK